ncbi:glutaminyl-peptide cyclotransferase [Carboxylicivirga sp. RSCT41]|uniref:glutaminyl-peptide cyclotransferase n=1 Tax=Carboxylicivirga agarovorans TaxID=3417570 RepID=UPI003D34FAF9
MKNILLIFACLLSGCGVYLEYPQLGNNVQWKLIHYNDTAVYRLAAKKALIDSVIDVSSKEVFHTDNKQVFKLPGSRLKPGINELSFNFYSGGKKRRSNEHLYMVSDTEPLQMELDDYYILKHDKEAFTQGLLFLNGHLFESTGLTGQSSLRIINPENGDLIRKLDLDPEIFAEGIASINDELHLLTWKDGLVYRFSHELEQLSIYPYRQEGWGLTVLNNKMIASDGSNKLYYLSDAYKVDSVVHVLNHRGAVPYINELECINGKIWANVLGDDKIIVINPLNGKVEVEIEASKCIDRHRYPDAGVMNGIAYDARNGMVYLTGKNWPYLIVWRLMSFDKSNK